MSYVNTTRYCPSCGSQNITVLVEKEKQSYDFCGGILGAICLGPIGLICGLCCADGEKKRVSCTCNSCGRRFNT